ncbi:branched-chain-amino-acid aminotransferase, cytosolic-like [Dysidea avara]|uniref:branched-chain-amino-acid aminotransferase, cytosolic-like n=1 Tax=Dysidea avara TaxID=196820 RepID=UPI003321090B
MVSRRLLSEGLFSNLPKHCCYSVCSRLFSSAPYKHDGITITKTTTPGTKPDPSTLKFGHTFTDHMLSANWTEAKGWEPPKITPVQNLSLHPAAPAFHYAIELFEGLKAFYGVDGKVRLFRPDMNCKRLNRSAELACLPQMDNEELLKSMIELIKLDMDWTPKAPDCSLYIRPTMIGTNASLGVSKATSAMFYTLLCPVGPYFTTGTFNPVSLYCDPQFVRSWPGGNGAAKMGSNYGPTIRTQLVAEEKGHQQVLWLFGEDHQLTEVGTMNLFVHWVNENGEPEIATAPLDGLILPGVTRDSILKLANSWGTHKVTERIIRMNDVKKALKEGRLKEMFGAGTACVVCPVKSINFLDEMLDIPTMESGCVVAKRAYKELTDIQFGRAPHKEWTILLE